VNAITDQLKFSRVLAWLEEHCRRLNADAAGGFTAAIDGTSIPGHIIWAVHWDEDGKVDLRVMGTRRACELHDVVLGWLTGHTCFESARNRPELLELLRTLQNSTLAEVASLSYEAWGLLDTALCELEG
jgi:hypothetical protein